LIFTSLTPPKLINSGVFQDTQELKTNTTPKSKTDLIYLDSLVNESKKYGIVSMPL